MVEGSLEEKQSIGRHSPPIILNKNASILKPSKNMELALVNQSEFSEDSERTS